ncbi:MAG: glutathione S-transferase N-terminal domain-containing protein [Alphaproteobacteria bacterium]|jgi:glutathione S-transferase
MLKLLSATPSPYARKVRIALAEKGIPFELVTENPWNRGASTPGLNPLGKVPVLILEDGSTVYESSYVLEWLEVHYPTPALFSADPVERLAARRFEVLADGVCDAIVLCLLESLRTKQQRSQPWIDRQALKIEGGLAEVARLVPEQGYCIGDTFGLADLSAGTMLGYLSGRYGHLDWRGMYPHLAAFHDRLLERPSFRDTVPVPQAMEAGVV